MRGIRDRGSQLYLTTSVPVAITSEGADNSLHLDINFTKFELKLLGTSQKAQRAIFCGGRRGIYRCFGLTARPTSRAYLCGT